MVNLARSVLTRCGLLALFARRSGDQAWARRVRNSFVVEHAVVLAAVGLLIPDQLSF